MQRLQILWHMAYYRIPRCRVKEHFLIAKSTLYRWLHAVEEGNLGRRNADSESPRKTPGEIARIIWDIFEANPYVGRHRIANILWLLGVFVAASTVRNILLLGVDQRYQAVALAEGLRRRPARQQRDLPRRGRRRHARPSSGRSRPRTRRRRRRPLQDH